MLEVKGVSKRFGAKVALSQVSLTVEKGEFLGVIGPNGCGKSTLLKVMSGCEHVQEGEVFFQGKPLGRYHRKELARKVGMVAQGGLPPLSFSVEEVVMMGRYAHQRLLQFAAPRDEQVVEEVLRQTNLRHLRRQMLERLSGGERQRVALAQVMAQQPEIVLLDEPTTYLDIGYQVGLMDLIQRWQQACGWTVVAVLHDLNLAAQYCTRLALMSEGSICAAGAPRDVLQAELVARVYGTMPIVLPHPVSGVPQLILTPQNRPSGAEHVRPGQGCRSVLDA